MRDQEGSEEGGSSLTSSPGEVREIDPTTERGQPGTVQGAIIPEIVISDYSCQISEEETAWRDNFLQNTIDSHILPKDSTNETREIVHMLKTALTYAKEESGRVPMQHIDHVYDQIISYIKGENSGPQNQKINKQKRRKGGNKRAYRRYIYARTQDLYKRNPGELAKYVREGTDWYESPNEELQEEEIRQTFEDLWGRTPVIQQPDAMKEGVNSEEIDLNVLLATITIGELRNRIKRIKQNTATGPDGILRKHIINPGTQEVLRLFFNFVTACGHQPTCWKCYRTTLLLKQGKDPSRVENYRPVTIGSLLSRIYWGIFDQKLQLVVRFTARQKGFVDEAGCFNNVHILNETLKLGKKRSGLVAVQLDISKAFDTVPHEAIGYALKKKGIPGYVTQSIKDSYEGISTIIKHRKHEIKLQIKQGVKQGGLLSPLLFNAVIEPLILQLERQQGFSINNDCKVSSLAFADDIILLALDVPEAKNLLEKTERYLQDLNMNISAPKCAAFRICTTKDTWYQTDPLLTTASGDKIPNTEANATIKFLGGRMSPWKGLMTETLEEGFEATLRRVERLALKPHQKANLISTYIIPHFLHLITLAVVPTTSIRRMDQGLRRAVRNIFHLPQCTADGLLYCKKKDGGLGVPRLETTAVSTSLKMGLKFMDNADPVMRALAKESQLEQR
jgi:ribosomal protein S15P/S13E